VLDTTLLVLVLVLTDAVLVEVDVLVDVVVDVDVDESGIVYETSSSGIFVPFSRE
jgi:uncharacterized membrane protein